MVSKNINKIFDLLDTWRNLPAYQLERRADIFFALYLPKIISAKFEIDAEYIIPEFPVRIGTIYNSTKLKNPNLSFKIDYVVVSKSAGKIYLVELKTDDGSRRDKQDWYLEKSKEIGIKLLVDGILDIYKATSSKKKYGNLLNILSEIGFIKLPENTNTCIDYDIEIVYIQPNNDYSHKLIISFENIAEILKDEDDILTNRFVQSLLRWKINPNS
jgi:hypothetical protein